MKHFYFLFLTMVFSFSYMNAQEACPQAGTTSAGGTQIIFTYPPATSFCVNRPTTIEVDGTTTFTLDPGSCAETISLYNITSGPAIIGQDFTVTSGFSSSCSYSSGTLPVDDYAFLNRNVRVYPNPLTLQRTMQISFGLPITGTINIFNVTGKQVFKSPINNQEKTQIDVANLTSGIYMLRVSTENASVTRKIVIMK